MKIKNSLRFGIFVFTLVCATRAFCDPPRVTKISQVTAPPTRSAVFQVPQRLRPRVDFWIDIFTRYGKDQVVLHHREYPQATFAVLDFADSSAGLTPLQAERYRKKRIKDVSEEILEAIRKLSRGGTPQGKLEQRVLDAMRLVPGEGKYQRVISDPDMIRSQTGIREKCIEAIQRSGQYIGEMERIFVRDFGLPKELTRLPIQESSFDYRAYSNVGAAGIWQFMRRTGMLYMSINRIVDERRDPMASTRAAAKYLQHAYEELGTWPLAVTSYNHGVVGVARRVRTFGTSDLVNLIENPYFDRPFGFASANFYPEFLAALDVYDGRATYFPNVRPDAPIETKTFELPRAMSANQLIKELKVSEDDLRTVNLAITDGVWSGRYQLPKGQRIHVPIMASERIERVKSAQVIVAEATPKPNPAYSAAVYRVRKGDSLASIAKRYHITINELKAANELEEDQIRVGQQLTIHRAKEPIKGEVSAEYIVKSGDTLHEISKRNGVSVARLREENNLSTTKLSIGQKLIIPKRSKG